MLTRADMIRVIIEPYEADLNDMTTLDMQRAIEYAREESSAQLQYANALELAIELNNLEGLE